MDAQAMVYEEYSCIALPGHLLVFMIRMYQVSKWTEMLKDCMEREEWLSGGCSSRNGPAAGDIAGFLESR